MSNYQHSFDIIPPCSSFKRSLQQNFEVLKLWDCL